MKKKIVVVIAFLLALSTALPYHSQAAAPPKETDVIIVYKNQKGKQTAIEESEKVNAQYIHLPAVAVTADEQAVTSLKQDPNIAYVSKNIKVKLASSTMKKTAASTNQDALVQKSYNLQKLNVKQAIKEGVTGKNVKVAVLDTGISPHEDLKISGGKSFVKYTSSYKDDEGHGTHVAGTIGALNNDYGTVGVASGAKLYAVKVLDKKGEGDLYSLLRGIDWAISNKMDILNLSLGFEDNIPILRSAVDEAYKKGLLVVAASGNDGKKNAISYPAAYNSVIAVSATTDKDKLASISNTGKGIEFSAPGQNVISTYLKNEYWYATGTSQAAPHVTGMLALLKQLHPKKTNVQLRTLLRSYTVDLGAKGKDPQFGYGRVQYIPQSSFLKAATSAVKTAETSKKQADVNQAKTRIGRLTASKQKTALTERVKKVQGTIDIRLARAKVQTAEKSKTQGAIKSAQTAIKKLNKGKEKTSLQNRLDKVKKQVAYQKKVTDAKQKVKKAEAKRTKKNKASAQSAVKQLKASKTKTSLQKRLNRIKV
ncbi:S8 family serine peptidase [Bacillus pumilus]|uniref:S8 family peptidase n=3 Tax=Bacillus pumilus TaxID=1408 RepID=UPI002016FFEF|nr:S8 family peptidase [Bacillus pumilus]WIG32382.1 S8 family serine peptidase [Bacillus pumilus]